MSDLTDKACDAVAARAKTLAKDATPETLKTIAEAVAQVHFGPQGADYRYDNRTRYEYHATHHNGAERNQAGFGPSEGS